MEQKCYVRHGAFIEGVQLFANAAFGIVAAEAKAMAPEQRQLLEVGHLASVGSRWDRASLAGSATGCFVG